MRRAPDGGGRRVTVGLAIFTVAVGTWLIADEPAHGGADQAARRVENAEAYTMPVRFRESREKEPSRRRAAPGAQLSAASPAPVPRAAPVAAAPPVPETRNPIPEPSQHAPVLPAVPPAPAVLPPQDSGPPLAPGEALRIHLWGQPDMTFNVVVDTRGAIDLPLAGYLEIAGLPMSKLEAGIEGRWRSYFSEPLAWVERRASNEAEAAWVIGTLNRPGKVPAGVSLRQALEACASGNINDLELVWLRGGFGARSPLYLSAPQTGSAAFDTLYLGSGDILYASPVRAPSDRPLGESVRRALKDPDLSRHFPPVK